MSKKSVQIFSKQFKAGAGYDLRIVDETATIMDYLDAINAFIDDKNLLRGERLTACKGCDGCCWERLPLTYIDVLKLLQAPPVQTALTDEQPLLTEFLAKFAYVYVEGPAVDITFGHKPHGACLWLDEARSSCRHYAWRPLVCQSFICSPSSKNAKELRSAIINQGMDELVRQALLTADAAALPLVIHDAYNPSIDPTDWPENPFSGKTAYDQVLLRDLCTVELWRNLRGKV